MNAGQQQFYNFALERAQAGKEEEMKAILAENFRKQEEGTFTKEYMAEAMPKLMALVRPECLEDFQRAAAHMRSTL